MNHPFRYFNSSPEVIRLAVMMYIRYPLSLRQVEDILFERGYRHLPRDGALLVAPVRSYVCWRDQETAGTRAQTGRTGAGTLMRCWSASTARDIIYGALSIMKGRCLRSLPRNGGIAEAALKFLKRTMKRYGQPCSIVTDRLRSYSAAMKARGNSGRQECERWLNHRAENSHQPFRRREGAMARFRDIKTLQKFTAAHASIHNHFKPPTPSHPPRHFQTTPSRRFVPVEPTASLTVLKKRFRRIESVSLTVPAKLLAR